MMSHQVNEEFVAGFRLVRQLGEGNFGSVWMAEGPGGTLVALKILELGGSTVGKREMLAIDRVKQVRHPNLAAILGVWGIDEHGCVIPGCRTTKLIQDRCSNWHGENNGTFAAIAAEEAQVVKKLVVAMSLGDKSLLDRLLECQEEGKPGIPPEELLRHLTDAARGIDYLHQPIHQLGSGPVALQHGDVKPANILLTGGVAQLCDFGLARVSGESNCTMFPGSPAYMAPECFRKQPGPYSDQYALAVTYVELRTGSLPFDSATLTALAESRKSGPLNVQALTPAERAVINRATSSNPRRRYEDCSTMVHELQHAWEHAKRQRVPQVVSKLSHIGVPVLGLLVFLAGYGFAVATSDKNGVFAEESELRLGQQARSKMVKKTAAVAQIRASTQPPSEHSSAVPDVSQPAARSPRMRKPTSPSTDVKPASPVATQTVQSRDPKVIADERVRPRPPVTAPIDAPRQKRCSQVRQRSGSVGSQPLPQEGIPQARTYVVVFDPRCRKYVLVSAQSVSCR